MSARLGIGVGRDSVRVVLVRQGAVAWCASAAVAEGDALREVLVRVLSGMPRSRWERVRLAAAIGPAASQVKRLEGLPPVKDRRVLAQLVAENAGRFFLRNGVPLRVTDVHVAAPGEVWAGAVEADVLEEIAAAARAAGARLDGTRPTVAVLPYAFRETDGGSAVWRDADTRAEVLIHAQALVRVRRLPALDAGVTPDQGVPTPALQPALHALGEGAWRFADAYGAAVAPPRAPLALHARTDAKARETARWTRLGVGAVLVAASAAAALIAPAVAASRTASRASARAERLRHAQGELVRTQAALVRLSGTLRQVATFGGERRSVLRLLGALATATPDSTGIVSLRVEGAAGSFVALAPRGAAILPALADVDEIAGLTIAGPVTREPLGGRELERVAVRFRVKRVAISSRGPRGPPADAPTPIPMTGRQTGDQP